MKNISSPQGIFSIKESINAKKKKRFRSKFKRLVWNILKNRHLESIYLFLVLTDEGINMQTSSHLPNPHLLIFIVILLF